MKIFNFNRNSFLGFAGACEVEALVLKDLWLNNYDTTNFCISPEIISLIKDFEVKGSETNFFLWCFTINGYKHKYLFKHDFESVLQSISILPISEKRLWIANLNETLSKTKLSKSRQLKRKFGVYKGLIGEEEAKKLLVDTYFSIYGDFNEFYKYRK